MIGGKPGWIVEQRAIREHDPINTTFVLRNGNWARATNGLAQEK